MAVRTYSISDILREEAHRIADSTGLTLKKMRSEDSSRAQLLHEPDRPTRMDSIYSDPVCVNDAHYVAAFTTQLRTIFDNLHARLLDEEDRLRGYIEILSAEWVQPDPRGDEDHIGCFRLQVKLPD